jgi:hypothetical protein
MPPPNNPPPQIDLNALILAIEALRASIDQQNTQGRGGGGPPVPTAGGGIGASIAARLGLGNTGSGRGAAIQGIGAQAMISSGLGGTRAALGRAGAIGLAASVAGGFAQQGARGAQSVIRGETNSATESLRRTNQIYTAANSAISGITGGLFNPYSDTIAKMSSASRIDNSGGGIIARAQAGARAIGAPLSRGEVNNVARTAFAFAAGQEEDFALRQTAIQKFGGARSALELQKQKASNSLARGDAGIFSYPGVDFENAKQAIADSESTNNEIVKAIREQTQFMKARLGDRGNK